MALFLCHACFVGRHVHQIGSQYAIFRPVLSVDLNLQSWRPHAASIWSVKNMPQTARRILKQGIAKDTWMLLHSLGSSIRLGKVVVMIHYIWLGIAAVALGATYCTNCFAPVCPFSHTWEHLRRQKQQLCCVVLPYVCPLASLFDEFVYTGTVQSLGRRLFEGSTLWLCVLRKHLTFSAKPTVWRSQLTTGQHSKRDQSTRQATTGTTTTTKVAMPEVQQQGLFRVSGVQENSLQGLSQRLQQHGCRFVSLG